ncbi:MAG: class I SAM-dependent methyltransferase [Acidobacteria bacterium]|nr:class I SAM-dependent methyltransferase [Acidobacteriota bacterium]
MMNPAEFANIAESEANFWWYAGMRQIMFALLDPVARHERLGAVLEAGCGTGHFSRELQQRYGWRMHSLDVAMEGLHYGRTYGLDAMVQADICALPYRTGAFDGVVSMDVIVHLERGREHLPLQEFARVLRPGGLLALRVSALDILRSHHSQHAMERQRFTRERLEQAVAAAGLDVLRVSYANALLLPVALFKFRVWEPLAGGEPDSGVKPVPGWLNRILRAPLALESRWLGRGGSFPAGQSLVLLARRRGGAARLAATPAAAA